VFLFLAVAFPLILAAPVGLLLPDLIKPLGDQPNDPRLEETIP